jgi:hypothetical protein
MRQTLITLSAALALGTMPAVVSAQSAGQVIDKIGTSYPKGFKSSGSSCKATGRATALPKVNSSCPKGFQTSNNEYCVSPSGAEATIKSGSCPSGFSTSNNKYCVKN